MDFTGVTFTVNGQAYGMPDGMLFFDRAAPATPTTIFTNTGGFTGNGFWTTTNPNDLSDEMFFVRNAILVHRQQWSEYSPTMVFRQLS